MELYRSQAAPVILRLLGLSLVLILSAACAAAPAIPDPATITPQASPTPTSPAAAEPDLVINPAASAGETIKAGVGDVLQVLPPDTESAWQIDFAGGILEPYAGGEITTRPGPDGWLLLAAGAGTTELRLTSVVVCESAVPCPQMPMQFVLTVLVR